MLRLPRYLRPVDIAAASYVLLYFAWLATAGDGSPGTILIGEWAFYPLGLAVAWANWLNARTAGLDRRTRTAWGLLALAALSLWVSGSIWSYYARLAGPQHLPRWLDWLELLQHVLAIAGYLCFPGRVVDRDGRTRFLLDIGLATVAGFVLAFHFGLRQWVSHPSALTFDYAVAGSALDWVLFVLAGMGHVHKRDPAVRRALALLLVANTVNLIANYSLAGMANYRAGDWVDGLWFLAWVMRWSAARLAFVHYQGVSPLKADVSAARGNYRSSAFSYVVVAGAFMLFIGQILLGDGRFLSLLAFSAALMAALLLLRQLVELRENRLLFAAQLAQEARFRSLVQNGSDIILVVDRDGVMSYVSPSASRVFGPATQLRPGANLSAVVVQSDLDALAPILASQAHPSAPITVRVEVTEGGWREVEVVSSDLRGDPAVRGIVLNCRDVSERNELERQLRHAQKLDAVGHLAGGLAHDFNNVLAVIRGYTELLHDDLPLNSTAREDLNYIEQAVDRAAAVTKKLLGLSRRQPVQPTVLDLNEVIRGLQPLLRQLLTARTEVVLALEPRLWPVKVDQGQIEQIVINLATNARDAMPDGGHLYISTGNLHVPAGDRGAGGVEAGEHVVLSVRDEGIGMDDKTRARIFEPFFSTKARDRGMGLGLAMVHGIVNDARGRIRVASAPGHGATFEIILSRTHEALTAPIAEAALPAPAPPSVTVLVVDDEPAVRVVGRRVLERAGYAVVEAEDGEAALALAARPDVGIDVLLTDMVMPGLHGSELIPRFGALRPGVPIVCVTGFAGERPESVQLDPCVAALVTKPFSSDALLRAVAAACQARAADVRKAS